MEFNENSICQIAIMRREGMTAAIFGATGAIGKEVLKELIASPRIKKINVISRRKLEIKNSKIVEYIIDFNNLSDDKSIFNDIDVAYCCIGSTRAKIGAEGFVQVDRDLVYESAKLLRECNCSHFNLVSSHGANVNSSFLYLKTKGEVEKLVTDLDFTRLSIFRPSLLICDREQSRPFEKIFQVLAKGFDWRSKFSISVETVAHAMVVNSFLESSVKVEVFENDNINTLGID